MVSKSDGDDNWSSFGDKAYEYFYQILYVFLIDDVDIFFISNCSWPLFYSSQFVFTKVLKRTTTNEKNPCQWHKKFQ